MRLASRSAAPAQRAATALLALVAAGLLCSWSALAAEGGKLLATGGASQLEGAAGGGLVPWALLAGYGTGDQWGAAVHITGVDTGDLAVTSTGAAVTVLNRVELS